MNLHHPLILFLVKRSGAYGAPAGLSKGLHTSAGFVVEMLQRAGQRARLEQVIDGNGIDRVVTQLRPARVVLEAIWTSPAKIAELKRLHPGVRWTVRVHSETPFLANEGMAVEWLRDLAGEVEIAFNSRGAREDFAVLFPAAYMPNWYPLRQPRRQKPASAVLDVGCFGAIRPLKNQLLQALAAIRFARESGRRLRFHVNSERLEQGGENNLKNLRALFSSSTIGEELVLVLHPWLEHEEFLELLAEMDLCLQVSLTESFNLVSADAVSMGVPLIGSPAIHWLPKRSRAHAGSAASVAEAMGRADATTVAMNHAALEDYLEEAHRAWMRWVEE